MSLISASSFCTLSLAKSLGCAVELLALVAAAWAWAKSPSLEPGPSGAEKGSLRYRGSSSLLLYRPNSMPMARMSKRRRCQVRSWSVAA
eukprot:7304506-Lingulodinium_polyedra.AAC.1